MKKILTIFLMFLFITNVYADKFEVTLHKCVDGDTAWFNYDGNNIKARFLAIDTPESTIKKEKYGKEASLFACNKLENANLIELEYDNNSDKVDKYDRELVWVFTDNELLQELILKEGLAQIKYIYVDYKYVDQLYKAEREAKKNQLNMWEEHNYFIENYLVYIILVIGIIIYLIYPKTRKNLEKLFKKQFKTNLKL